MKLSTRERNIVIVVGAVIGLFLVDRYAWTPYMEARERSRGDLAAARNMQAKVLQVIRYERVHKETFDRMIADGLKSDASAAESQIQHAVDDWKRDARLELTTVKRERMEQDKVFGRIVYRASGSGTMSSIARFLWNVQTSRIPSRIVDLQIAGRQGAKEGTDDLTVTVAISTLVRGQVPATTGPSAAGSGAVVASVGREVR
jgi:hypothetical protein